jgi:hypothetical protein
MRSLPVLRRSPLIVIALLVAVTTAGAQGASQVTKLRTAKVTLFDCASGTKKTDLAQKDFQGPWPVTGPPTPDGLLPVKVNGDNVCVRVYAVETDKVITTSSDCNAVVAANQPRSGATRGVGEDCKKK